ncbi:hypothetical protein [uncultured Legionella sp.]|uniref:hypothetical protein n=1 Tax=uncultured Legionella sp. TaxID=210934 RepID=UPI00262000B7|nr:hypothetical protein [uncultured Legionella sp.]
MNQRKLLIEQIELVDKQLKNEHHQYIAYKEQVWTVFSDPRLLLAAGVCMLVISYKIYKGPWRTVFKSLVSYALFFASNQLKKQIVSRF